MWLNQSFVVDHALDNQLEESFVSLRTGKPVKIIMKPDGEVFYKKYFL
jgi:hypothetical protein